MTDLKSFESQLAKVFQSSETPENRVRLLDALVLSVRSLWRTQNYGETLLSVCALDRRVIERLSELIGHKSVIVASVKSTVLLAQLSSALNDNIDVPVGLVLSFLKFKLALSTRKPLDLLGRILVVIGRKSVQKGNEASPVADSLIDATLEYHPSIVHGMCGWLGGPEEQDRENRYFNLMLTNPEFVPNLLAAFLKARRREIAGLVGSSRIELGLAMKCLALTRVSASTELTLRVLEVCSSFDLLRCNVTLKQGDVSSTERFVAVLEPIIAKQESLAKQESADLAPTSRAFASRAFVLFCEASSDLESVKRAFRAASEDVCGMKELESNTESKCGMKELEAMIKSMASCFRGRGQTVSFCEALIEACGRLLDATSSDSRSRSLIEVCRIVSSVVDSGFFAALPGSSQTLDLVKQLVSWAHSDSSSDKGSSSGGASFVAALLLFEILHGARIDQQSYVVYRDALGVHGSTLLAPRSLTLGANGSGMTEEMKSKTRRKKNESAFADSVVDSGFFAALAATLARVGVAVGLLRTRAFDVPEQGPNSELDGLVNRLLDTRDSRGAESEGLRLSLQDILRCHLTDPCPVVSGTPSSDLDAFLVQRHLKYFPELSGRVKLTENGVSKEAVGSGLENEDSDPVKTVKKSKTLSSKTSASLRFGSDSVLSAVHDSSAGSESKRITFVKEVAGGVSLSQGACLFRRIALEKDVVGFDLILTLLRRLSSANEEKLPPWFAVSGLVVLCISKGLQKKAHNSSLRAQALLSAGEPATNRSLLPGSTNDPGRLRYQALQYFKICREVTKMYRRNKEAVGYFAANLCAHHLCFCGDDGDRLASKLYVLGFHALLSVVSREKKWRKAVLSIVSDLLPSSVQRKHIPKAFERYLEAFEVQFKYKGVS